MWGGPHLASDRVVQGKLGPRLWGTPTSGAGARRRDQPARAQGVDRDRLVCVGRRQRLGAGGDPPQQIKLARGQWEARGDGLARDRRWRGCARAKCFHAPGNVARQWNIHKPRSTIQFVDRTRAPAPPLLPIFRSRQQVELLAFLLGDPLLEVSLSDLADRLGTPYPSVHREIDRAVAAGLVSSRKVGNTRLVRANTRSPYFDGLSQVLTRAFGVPAVLASALQQLDGICEAFIYGSWAARYLGTEGQRPVEDIDVLVLGEPDRDQLYAAIEAVEPRLGRPLQVTIRDTEWLTNGGGAFHDTVLSRPMVPIPIDEPEPSAS